MKSRFPILLAVMCAVVFAAGLVQLFNLRFEAGDVYPAYSSLRADPLGTMAFYESLARLPGLEVERDFRPTNKLPEGKALAYLHLAARRWDWRWISEEQFREIEAFVRGGGRLVVAFLPETARPFFSVEYEEDEEGVIKPKVKPGKSKEKKDARNETPPDSKSKPAKKAKKQFRRLDDDEEYRTVDLGERWGVQLGFEKLKAGEGETFEPVQVHNRSGLDLPATLDWHSGMVFTNVATDWHTVYARGTNAVVIERSFGRGTVAMASDCYFLSNEAMRKNRHTDLLAWLIGPAQRVVFDEAHLGILEGQGVAVLIRKYRLHGLAAGLLLLAALFVWKNATSFVPAYANRAQESAVVGKAASAGFVNLLRRNLPEHDLLRVCFDEWKKSLARTDRHSLARLSEVHAAITADHARPARQRDPVATYRGICRLLNRSQPQVPSSEFRVPSSESNPPTKP